MFPPIVPCRLGEVRAGSIYGSDRGDIADTILIGGDADNGPVLSMQLNVFTLKLPMVHLAEVPERRKPSPEWTGNVFQRREERLTEPSDNLKKQ